MSQALDLRDVQALTDLQAALGRFADGALESLAAAEAEIHRELEWLHERVGYWQREVERARQEVARAEAALRRCEASGYMDQNGRYHRPDCSREARGLAQAQAHLRECEDRLRTAQAWRSQVEQAADEYGREARRLHDLATGHTGRARAFLEVIAARYAAVGAAASAVGSVLAAVGTGGERAMPASALVPPIQPTTAPSVSEAGITWAEHRATLQKMESGQPITPEDLQRLQQPISDLQAGTLDEDAAWVQRLLDAEHYQEAMHDSREAQDLKEALLAVLKAINHWRTGP